MQKAAAPKKHVEYCQQSIAAIREMKRRTLLINFCTQRNTIYYTTCTWTKPLIGATLLHKNDSQKWHCQLEMDCPLSLIVPFFIGYFRPVFCMHVCSSCDEHLKK